MEFWLNVLNQGLIVAVFAVSLNVILGYAGQLSIAPAGLGGVGGYVAGYLSAKHGWDFGFCLAAGAASGLTVGTVLGLPALRLGEDYLILLTLAFATVITAVLSAIPALGGTYGLLGIKVVDIGGPLTEPSQLLRMTVPICLACCVFCWRLAASPFGRVLLGIREDADATQAVGKSVVAFKILTFSLTSAVAGIGGVLLVFYDQIASPGQFNFDATTIMIAAVIIGGIGNLAGAFLGAIVLSFIGPVLQKTVDLTPDTASLWQLVIYGALLALVMRVRPSGLIPEGTSLRGLLHRMPRLPALGPAEPAAAPVGGPMALVTDHAASHPIRTDELRGHRTAAHGVTARLPPAEDHVILPPQTARTPISAGEPVLVARGLVKHFGGIRAVQGLDIELQAGRITALVGPNGAGKTTVFNLLTGRIRPDRGDVVLRGRDITGLPPNRVTALGMVRSFQDVRTLARMTLLDNARLSAPGQPGESLVDLFARPSKVRRGERETTARALECLHFVGLADRALERAGGLGYGDQKLLAIARVLATGADVLLVDEPASGIDRGNLEPVLEVIERLRDEGKTICLVEHNLDVVTRLADRVLFMEQGKVTAEGTMDEITKIERLSEVYFGRV